MRRIRKNSIYDVYCISQYLYQCYSLVEVTDSAVLVGVAEVVSSNPRWVIKYFSAFTGIVDSSTLTFIPSSSFGWNGGPAHIYIIS